MDPGRPASQGCPRPKGGQSALVELIQRLSKLVTDFPIKELDLNPVMAFEKGAVAVDARIAV